MKVVGQLVDIHTREIYPAIVTFMKGRILNVERTGSAPNHYILPGLIDSHIHIESSMVTPGAFSMTAVSHGTTGIVSDPHEIANVLGLNGVKYMIEDGNKVPLRFWFGAPSCVPATGFETSGAVISLNEIRELLSYTDIKYLSEMMNFPGVINDDEEVMAKISIAREAGKPVDGHAPGLSGEILRKYVLAGISTDHECSTIEEAREKISLGMKILIREGSAARNMNALKGLYLSNPEMLMLCSDDLHPEKLMRGHINKLIAHLYNDGLDLFDLIRSATHNPVKHYNLEAGLLRKGDYADLIIVDSLQEMNVLETWISGKNVFKDGNVNFDYKPGKAVNNFTCTPIEENDIIVKNRRSKVRIIEAFDGELLTKELFVNSGTRNNIESDTSTDILKIVVKDRYTDLLPAVGFIKGFGLKKGAFASSIAHDSHNIISIGTNDEDIVRSVNQIINMKGGLAVSSGEVMESFQLNIGGIMTTRSCRDVAADYEKINNLVRSLGCKMEAPFMTLSFMALLVIPELKIGDKGLFDVKKFELVSLFV